MSNDEKKNDANVVESPDTADDKKSLFDPRTEFLFRGERLKYFIHPLNNTFDNERAVEIPVGSLELERAGRNAQILEIGDVLWQYGFDREREVLDLGSSRPEVKKRDAQSVQRKYDLILSLSSFEHIGIDIFQGSIFRVVATINHLCGQLNPNGKFFFTIPVGYNRVLDEWLLAGEWPGKVRYLMRVTRAGMWIETDRTMVRSIRYGYPYPAGNAIIVAEWKVSANAV